MTLEEILTFLDIKASRQYLGDHTKIDKKFLDFFDKFVEDNIKELPPRDILWYLASMDGRELLYGKKDLMNKLVHMVSKEMSEYDFEDMCFYNYIFLKHSEDLDLENQDVKKSIRVI